LAKGERREVLVKVDRADGIQAMDLALGYDPKLVSVVDIRAVDVGAPLHVVTNDNSGTVNIAAYGVLPLSGSGAVLSVTVEARAPLGLKVPLRVRGEANEGGIPLVGAGQGSAPAAPGVKKPQPSRSGR